MLMQLKAGWIRFQATQAQTLILKRATWAIPSTWPNSSLFSQQAGWGWIKLLMQQGREKKPIFSLEAKA